MMREMELNGFEKGGQRTLLKTTLHLRDREVRALRELKAIKLLVFCPSQNSSILFQLTNKGADSSLRHGDALLSIEADKVLFQAIMNPKLRVTLLSENEKADFRVSSMGPAHVFSSRDPLLEIMRYGYQMG